ncbi:DHH family phosphoesterase [Patescibacteria group bacterium]|nr:DHH family phosphoesterase [Patescibacteria group bacterium]
MSLPLHEQFLGSIERSNRPLIVLAQSANPDDFACGFAISAFISKMQKPIEIISPGGRPPKSLNFLGENAPIHGDLKNIRKLTITLKSTNTKIDELSYDVKDDLININLVPKTGDWKKEDIQIKTDDYKYDLIIAIGGQKLESFGSAYKTYSDFFYSAPIINIDHSSSNEHFGQINLVDINTVASSEICYNLLRKIDEGIIDSEIATFLLTGMIYKTKSFKSANVSPQTLKIASQLMASGARREDIVTNLYKTRSVETLRLWGRALARLKSDKAHGLVWTLITKQDFANAGAGIESLDSIIEELISTSPDAKIAAIFHENEDDNIHVILHAARPHDALFLGAPFSASGTREQAKLKIKETDIVRAEKKVITHFKNQIQNII